jgi:hypothetical protein
MRRKSPYHWLDFTPLPILLKIFWEPFSKKKSHWWHWRKFDQSKVRHELNVEGYSDAQPRDTVIQNLVQTNFKWQHVLILEPDTDGLNKYYQIGFLEPKSGICQKCSLVLKGLTAVLVGPNDVLFFAVSLKSGKCIQLKIVGITIKNKLKGIKLI